MASNSTAPPPVLVLTFATEETAYLPALRASAAAQGFRFEVIGLGHEWQGFMWANALLMERVQRCDPDELVLVLDGYDTLIVMPCVDLVASYEKFCVMATSRAGFAPQSPPNRWLVFGIEHPREAASWPYWNTIVRTARRYHCVPPSADFYLNTGAVLGPAKHVHMYMEETCKHAAATGNKDDQNTANSLYWGWWFDPNEDRVSRRDSPIPIALDTECELFYCHCERRLLYLIFGLARSPNNFKTNHDLHIAMKDGRILRKFSNKPIGVIHGIWNTNMNAVCKYMGYPYNPDYHKEVSQPDIRVFARVTRALLIWPGGPVLLLALFAYPTGFWGSLLHTLLH
ncbi:hypothetical protein AB1Y20_006796 [Prymnesium parvum]|uniref:PLOD1-3-like GT domain-containing protein n=1 Tax=Prymnesium parvum TaxID=97485 RepID=A0AB34J0Q0_PRYPA